MSYPEFRFRRLRRTDSLRRLVREHRLSIDDLIYPIFIEEHITDPVPIASMPGVMRYPERMITEVVQAAAAAGIHAVILFGVSHCKDEAGSDTWSDEGLMVRMIRAARAAAPDITVISDNCFCEYTTHGHCGVIHDDDVVNDATLENLCLQSLAAARAGVDMLAPSGMMDGMIGAMRSALDADGFNQLPIMSYSTKFASAFYGPFRDAVDSTFKGSRSAYQMDPANGREAIAESVADEQEGADILMVKPGIAYLDVISAIRQRCDRPLAVYQVSGEYAMIKAASAAGVIDEKAIVLESMTAFRRAGADLVLTYFAPQLAQWIREGY